MDQKADEAIQQIEDKNYDMDLKNDGYKYVRYYGIAFLRQRMHRALQTI